VCFQARVYDLLIDHNSMDFVMHDQFSFDLDGDPMHVSEISVSSAMLCNVPHDVSVYHTETFKRLIPVDGYVYLPDIFAPYSLLRDNRIRLIIRFPNIVHVPEPRHGSYMNYSPHPDVQLHTIDANTKLCICPHLVTDSNGVTAPFVVNENNRAYILQSPSVYSFCIDSSSYQFQT